MSIPGCLITFGFILLARWGIQRAGLSDTLFNTRHWAIIWLVFLVLGSICLMVCGQIASYLAGLMLILMLWYRLCFDKTLT